MSCCESFNQSKVIKITIITVCYNEKNKTKKTIESVSDQTYPYIEHLVIDGASTDGTIDILKEFSEKKMIKAYSENDYGIYNAMNRGITKANGDYIFFLNAGDIFYDKYVVENMAFYIKKDINTIYYGKACLISADGSKTIYTFPQDKLAEGLSDGSMPCHQTIFSPRKFLVNHYFREQYKIRADYEWLMYWLNRGIKCESVPIIVSYYDTTGTSGRIKNSVLLLKEQQEIIDEYQKKGQNVLIDGYNEIREKKAKKINEQFKYYYMFQLMNRWMILRKKNISIGLCLQKKNYKHIAIYGMGSMGYRLLEDLEGSNIEIDYVVDQNADNICVNLPILLPDRDFPEVDIMIVTAVTYFNEIEERLRESVFFPIISLEDIIYAVEDV